MIQFSLRCDADHQFDSWFQSADAFDTLQKAGMISCAICGSKSVEKALMAPRVRGNSAAPEPAPPAEPSPAEQALSELRRKIEENSDYVGLNFASEARDMHAGLSPGRSIYGEAKADEARKLIEEGVPVAPLPFLPRRKSN